MTSQDWTDARGRTWHLRLTIGALDDLRDAGIDLMQPESLTVAQIADAVVILTRDQLAQRGLDQRDLRHALDGPALARAIRALGEACRFFSDSLTEPVQTKTTKPNNAPQPTTSSSSPGKPPPASVSTRGR